MISHAHYDMTPVMTGTSNKQSLKNFENIGREFFNKKFIY